MKNICKNCFEKEATQKVRNYKVFPEKEFVEVCDDCRWEFDPELYEEKIVEIIGRAIDHDKDDETINELIKGGQLDEN